MVSLAVPSGHGNLGRSDYGQTNASESELGIRVQSVIQRTSYKISYTTLGGVPTLYFLVMSVEVCCILLPQNLVRRTFVFGIRKE